MQVLQEIPENKRYGIAAARALFNASQPATVNDGAGNQIPNPALFASDEAYLTARCGDLVDGWCLQADVANAPPPAPPPPGVINGVPQEVSARQAVQELIATGYHSDVEADSKVYQCINRIADPVQRAFMRAEFDRSQVFLRQRPSLMLLALTPSPNGLGMTAADLDQMFVRAAARG